jgi:hypothetical protein
MLRTEELMQALTIRQSVPHDAETLTGLAQLDSSRPLREPALVAEVGDEIWAAVSLRDERVVADPFRPSGAVVPVLVERARQLRRDERRKRNRQRFGAVVLPRHSHG